MFGAGQAVSEAGMRVKLDWPFSDYTLLLEGQVCVVSCITDLAAGLAHSSASW